MSDEDRLHINLRALLEISPEVFLKYIQSERNHARVQNWIDEPPTTKPGLLQMGFNY